MNSLCILVMKPYRIRFVPFEPNIDALSLFELVRVVFDFFIAVILSFLKFRYGNILYLR